MSKQPIFTGSGVAIVTPFTENNEVNYPLLGELIDFQIENGTDAIIICGTTGEGSTLTHEEHAGAIQFAVDHTAHRVPVIAGTGSNDTAYAVYLSNEAEKAGVDGLLVVTPYYNKTSQAGLTGIIPILPITSIRRSLPITCRAARASTSSRETYRELAKHPLIVGAKEANGDISALAKTVSFCGDNLNIYSGNDDQITSFMSLGAKGVISVLQMLRRALRMISPPNIWRETRRAARELQIQYLDLCNDLFIDVNPIPAKEALVMMGWEVRQMPDASAAPAPTLHASSYAQRL